MEEKNDHHHLRKSRDGGNVHNIGTCTKFEALRKQSGHQNVYIIPS